MAIRESEGVPLGFSRETTIRRDREGRWFHDGVEVTHPGVRSAFDRWIDRAEDGRYCLRNRIHWVYVAIEGPPIVVRRAHPGAGGVELELSDGRRERLASKTLRQGRDGVLYCEVRDGTMPASFTRIAQLSLEPLVGEDEAGVYLEIAGSRVHPPVVDEPLELID